MTILTRAALIASLAREVSHGFLQRAVSAYAKEKACIESGDSKGRSAHARQARHFANKSADTRQCLLIAKRIIATASGANYRGRTEP